MALDLEKALEAMLFSTSEPVAVKELLQIVTRYQSELAEGAPEDGENGTSPPAPEEEALAVSAGQIREALQQLRERLVASDSVYDLVEGPTGFRLVIKSGYADWVRLLRKEPRPVRVSQAALETLAIIAYRQPVTRAEMERIRGVGVDGPLQKLSEFELIETVGRADLPGRPVQFGTTEKFLEFCGIRSLEDLPSSDVLSAARLDEWLDEGEAPTPGNADLGLPVEEEVTLP